MLQCVFSHSLLVFVEAIIVGIFLADFPISVTSESYWKFVSVASFVNGRKVTRFIGNFDPLSVGWLNTSQS